MAEDGWCLEKERLGWGIVVVSIILWLHDLLGRQIGADGFFQGSGVRWDGDLECGHYDRCHIAGLLHHGGRGQIGGLGRVDLHNWWWRRQVSWLRGPDNRNHWLHGRRRQINWRWQGHRSHTSCHRFRGQISRSRSGQVEGDARWVIVVARMIVVIMVFMTEQM